MLARPLLAARLLALESKVVLFVGVCLFWILSPMPRSRKLFTLPRHTTYPTPPPPQDASLEYASSAAGADLGATPSGGAALGARLSIRLSMRVLLQARILARPLLVARYLALVNSSELILWNKRVKASLCAFMK